MIFLRSLLVGVGLRLGEFSDVAVGYQVGAMGVDGGPLFWRRIGYRCSKMGVESGPFWTGLEGPFCLTIG